jgi:hypothetical protein
MGSAEEAERARVEEGGLNPEAVAALSCRGRDVGGGFAMGCISSSSCIESTCRKDGLVVRFGWSGAVGASNTSDEMESLWDDWREVFLLLKRAFSLLRASIVRSLSGVSDTFMVDPDRIMSSNSCDRSSENVGEMGDLSPLWMDCFAFALTNESVFLWPITESVPFGWSFDPLLLLPLNILIARAFSIDDLAE